MYKGLSCLHALTLPYRGINTPTPPTKDQCNSSSTEPCHVYFTSVSFLKLQNIKAQWSEALYFKGYRRIKGSVIACSVSAGAMSELMGASYPCSIPAQGAKQWCWQCFSSTTRAWKHRVLKGFQVVQP